MAIYGHIYGHIYAPYMAIYMAIYGHIYAYGGLKECSKGVIFLHEIAQNLTAPTHHWSGGESGVDAGDDGDLAAELARAPPGAAPRRFVKRSGRCQAGGGDGCQRCGEKG